MSIPNLRHDLQFRTSVGGFLLCLLMAWTKVMAAVPADAIQAGFDERNLPPVRELLQTGDYEACARLSEVAIARGQPSPQWGLLRMKALFAMGHGDEAWDVAGDLVKRHPDDLESWMAFHDMALSLGKKAEADEALRKLNEATKRLPAPKRTAKDMVMLGRAALAIGADPQKVIAQFFDPAKKKDKGLVDVYLALGGLALQKEDYARAADEFRAGLKEHADEIELRMGLAQAYESSDRKKCAEMLDQVLAHNPHHATALCLQAAMLISAEKFDEAAQTLDRVVAVNALHPDTWAYRAVLALLVKNNPDEAEKNRIEGLKMWAQNPQVDHVIGRCLSRAYRFREGAEHQRVALKINAAFLPAKLQLVHDLFRLGQEDEAWKLAKEIRDVDGYNQQAHNIGLLEDEMKGFVTRDEGDFVMRMPKRDSDIYGARALVLLREAKALLGAKYGLTMDKPVLVEFFPSQSDFAIRTFGNLGGQGILGACFGTVVTMNSPGSLSARRSNWESTLWHEFCHVVTLSVTKNRMPRWLSEGISVYEEQQRDASWGMRMSAEHREKVMNDETLTPMSKLTSAFLNAKDGDALMFAYYESAQAVDYLIKTYGMEKFRSILSDLAKGVRINEAIGKNTVAMDKLEPAFVKHVRDAAAQLAPKADWSEPEEDLNRNDPGALAAYLKKHPDNIGVLKQRIQMLLGDKKWKEAADLATHLVNLFPDDVENGCGYDLAAAAYRGSKRDHEEATVLREWTRRSGDAAHAFNRLMELDLASKNWAELEGEATRSLAINPFLKQPNEALASAAEALGRPDVAIGALKKLMILGPDNPVETNFKLARLLKDKDRPAARRYVLDALAEAPRFREGQRLLLEMQVPQP